MIDLVLFSRVKCQGRERFSYKTLRCSAPQYLSCLWLDGAKCAHSKIYEKISKGAAHRNICMPFCIFITNVLFIILRVLYAPMCLILTLFNVKQTHLRSRSKIFYIVSSLTFQSTLPINGLFQ